MSARRSPLRAFMRRYVIALGMASTFMGGGVLAVNYVIDHKLDAVPRVNVHTAKAPPQGANYLLIGSDTRAFVKNTGDEDAFGDPSDQGGQRSDTMMVVHVEPGAQRTLVVSFPRDLYVNIPGQGRSLINAAFNDGPNKVVETLQSNFGIEINHYMEVDFKSFRGIVKAIGNVPVYFPYPARDWFCDPETGRCVNPTGLYTPSGGCPKLDGGAALAYVRARHLQYYSTVQDEWLSADPRSDLDRITRQQDFMRKLAGIAVQKSLNNPLTANDVADRVLENLKIDQNLTKDDIFSLIDAFRTVDPNDPNSINFQTFPNDPDSSGNHLVPKEPDAKAMATRLMDFSGDQPVLPTVLPQQVTLKVLNGSGQPGAAAGALEQFVQIGFNPAGTANDDRATVDSTEVRYRSGQRDKGKLVLKFISPDARLIEDRSLTDADISVVLGVNFQSILVPGVASSSTVPTVPADPSASTVPTTQGPTTTVAQVTPTTPTTTAAPNDALAKLESEFGKPAPRKPPC
jgi:LCP family protein required for cell wall assembly